MTEDKAIELLNYWVSRLNLNSWSIYLDWKVRAEDMNLADSWGCVNFVFSTRQAYIQMLDEVDYTDTRFVYDYEKTLVHELLHLVFSVAENDDEKENKFIHQLIDDMAKALVECRRDGN